MSRPLDWSAVGWDRDPTPGDPDAVADLAARFRRTAEAVRTAADGLRSIRSSDTYKGEGGEELRERTRDLAGKVKEVEARYAEAADALHDYQREQYAAQRTADAALWRAQSAQSQLSSASSTLSQLPGPPLDGTVEDFQVTMARSAAQRADSDARVALGQAQDDVRRAHEAHDEAGARAARKLRDVIADDGLSDSNWDDVKGNAVAVVKGLAKVMDVIATVAGVLALVLAWVPVVGQVLALVALVATAISFVAHLTLLATGNEDWRATFFAAIGLVTAGVARVAMAGGRAAVRMSRVRAHGVASTRNIPNRAPRRLVRRPENKGARADRLIGGRLTAAEKDLGRAMKRKPVPKIHATARHSLSPSAVRQDLVLARKELWTNVKAQRPSLTAWRQEVLTPWRPTFNPLSEVDAKLLASPEVHDVATAAKRYRLAAQMATGVDRVNTGYGAYVLVRGEDGSVDVVSVPELDGTEAQEERRRQVAMREWALAGTGFRRQIVVPDPAREEVPVGPPYRDAAARP